MHTSHFGSRRPFGKGLRRRAGSLLVAAALVPLAVVIPSIAPQAAALASGLFFSEYIEGSSNNKALEIYNATGAAVDLPAGSYSVQMYFNGSPTAGLTINLTGTLAGNDVFVLAQASANAAILAQADQTNGAGWFNGDDAVVLRSGTTVLDVIGQIGFDPGTEWGSGPQSTADNTLQRAANICGGDPIGSDTFLPATEWVGLATDTFGGLGSHTSSCAGDGAPAVQSTIPANGTTGVARAANIVVTFTEPVTVSGTWFTIACATSGAHAAAVAGGPTAFTLDPDTDFAANEACTVTIVAANVSDQDTDDPPDFMTTNAVIGFTTIDTQVCGDPATPIHTIQGSGSTSPLNGSTNISIEGVVIGDFQGAGQFGGYYVQEEDAERDADPATSEGIFVFNTSFPVAAGDRVRARGNVTEFTSTGITLTELVSVSSVLVCQAGGASVTATPVALPVPSIGQWERYEGMLITLTQTLTVTETFRLARFGELSLSVNGRLFNPTNIVDPGLPAIAQQDLNNRSRILLDDGNGQQNIDPTRYPTGGLSASNTLRSGSTTTGVVGVLDHRFGVYRVQPTTSVSFNSDQRPATPGNVGGTLKIASMNVLNFFNGPAFPTSRGAETSLELERQTAKIVAALAAMNADVIGLMEIENDTGPTSALAQLTAALNAVVGSGTYGYVDTGVIGGDQIRVAFLYKTATVAPIGAFKTLTSAVDPLFIDNLNRPALAQTFSQNVNGQRFTAVVNHLKSKGSGCNAVGDPDIGDGQGNCNLTRTAAATALANWLDTDPTGSGDPDFIIIGDLNSYAKEDPIRALEADGYTNLVATEVGASAYSFVFDGQSGYLDHALANASLAAQVTGVTEWHINADEPIALDYNTNFKSANHINTLFAPTPFRSSDHDPLIVGICQAPTLAMSVTPNVLRPPNHKYRTVIGTPTASGDTATVTLLSVTSNEPDDGLGDGDTANDIVIVDDLTVALRAERSGTGSGRIYTLTWQATNTCGATAIATATVTVPKA